MISNHTVASQILELIISRRSVRKYLPEPVPDEDIRTMLTAASWAPSGGNKQNWHFVIVRSKEIISKIADEVRVKVELYSEEIDSSRARKEFLSYSRYYTVFESAPVLIGVVKKPYDSLTLRIMKRYNLGGSYHSSADVQGPAAAIENLMLMAHSLGYGTCWMTGPLIARSEIEKVLNISTPDELIALVPLGKPDGIPTPPGRKDISEIISYV